VEGTNKYGAFDHCGACGVSCQDLVLNGTTMCDATAPQPRCVVDECFEGFWKASDLSCMGFPESLCMPCASDGACQVPGDACLPAGTDDKTYCLWDCSDESLHDEIDPEQKTCPEGFYCKETDDQGSPLFMCMPLSDTCDCLEMNDGETRICEVSNDFGTCLGQEFCNPDNGWVGCDASTPAFEVCNNLDDDCNGVTDEYYPQLSAPCFVGVGLCRTVGIMVCNEAGDGVECNASPGLPVPEACNGEDDDCDEDVDEDWQDKGKVCVEGVGECLATGTWECTPDGSGLDCDAEPGTPETEACDGADNDCDGQADEDWDDLGKACTEGQGLCFATGTWVCMEDGADIECSAVPGLPVVEVCDGEDNDCDGDVDEDWANKGRVCTEGVGECFATGTFVCTDDGSGLDCDAEPGLPQMEICDGLDNDCDGDIDEDWPDKGKPCSDGQGECLVNGVQVCTGDGTGIECDAVAGTPEAEICDGLDNDCDGGIDEDWPDKGKPCSDGQGECLMNGVQVCNVSGTGLECDAVAGTPEAEECDGLDNDCDGDIDEDWPNKGSVCTVGQGECLANGVNVCTGDGTGIECDAVVGTPTSESCDGLDNDCDGGIDENWPDKGKPCSEGQGECLVNGVQVCNGPGTGLECDAVPGSPTSETCDGLDNDCDGGIDENWPTKGQSCSAGEGECLASGVNVCRGDGSGIECDAVPGTPTSEGCDYLDNDCDGDTDEDFILGGKYYLDTSCGNCFTDCTAIYSLPNAYGTCDYSGTPTCLMNCNGGYFNLNGVPDDGCEFYLDTDAIYVSADDGVDDGNCGLGPAGTGSGYHPCATIGYGLSRAVSTGRSRVLVADGLYEETVTLSNGISLLGGYRADTWERHLSSTLSIIRGTDSGTHRNTVVAVGITSSTMVQGFVIYGQNNSNVGGNSYAIYISGSDSDLQVMDNVVYSGTGGPGQDRSAASEGTDGTDGEGRNSPGVDTDDYDAFVTSSSPCGSGNNRQHSNGGLLTCGSDNINGGDGGGNTCPPSGGSEDSGTDGSGGNPGSGGLGGSEGSGGDAGNDGEMDGPCYLPGSPTTGADGTNGTEGDDGSSGSGCTGTNGTVSGGHWVGSSAGVGGDGGNGGGGGGGGAGGGGECTSNCGGDDRLGGHGGGGGSGGCGGDNGTGGGAGGASIAIFIVNGSAPTIQDNVIFLGIGGQGGDGGNGGVGGAGGNGGDGGVCPGSCWCYKSAGKGGEGGPGGAGGGGGGGCGGVSMGVYTWSLGGSPDYCGGGDNNTFGGGSGGTGGEGGVSMGNSGDPGSAGSHQNCSYN